MAAVASQRRLVSPVSSAPASSCLPKLESSSSRLAWIASRSATAALTAAAAWALVIIGTVIGTSHVLRSRSRPGLRPDRVGHVDQFDPAAAVRRQPGQRPVAAFQPEAQRALVRFAAEDEAVAGAVPA